VSLTIGQTAARARSFSAKRLNAELHCPSFHELYQRTERSANEVKEVGDFRDRAQLESHELEDAEEARIR
jgi:hypothetical protein